MSSLPRKILKIHSLRTFAFRRTRPLHAGCRRDSPLLTIISSAEAAKVLSSADRIITAMDLQNNGEEEKGTLQFAVLATAPPPPPKPQQQSAPRARAPTRRVDHTYRDYSRLPWDKQPVSGKTSKFPAKLHKILSNPEFSHVRLLCCSFVNNTIIGSNKSIYFSSCCCSFVNICDTF